MERTTPRLRVTSPRTRIPERAYALDVVLNTILDQTYDLEFHDRDDVLLCVDGDNQDRALVVSDTFFAAADVNWCDASTLPSRPLAKWNHGANLATAVTVAPSIPIIFGRKFHANSWLKQCGRKAYLGLDVFGSAFFMLTRYEEVVKQERDRYGRFPARSSLAHQEGFLERPIINEYAEILWSCMQRLWPQLRRKRREPRVILSHDVDWPLLPASNLRQATKAIAYDITRARTPAFAMRRARAFWARRRGNVSLDPYNTFDMLMSLSERHGLRSVFNFIAGHSDEEFDGEYTLQDTFIRDLLTRVHERGHEIGLHPSFNTYRDPKQLALEFRGLKEAAERLGIHQDAWGGRQHYLRWEAPSTWQAYEDAGLSYDSTLAYAESAGFRGGVCCEFPTFNLLTRRRLSLLERPLVVMEVTLLEQRYMALSHDAAKKRAVSLMECCRKFGGDFTLLWHNSSFKREQDVTLYQNIVSAASNASG